MGLSHKIECRWICQQTQGKTVKGYSLIFAVDYSKTFALVARLDTIRLWLAIYSQKCWKIFELDVKLAF